MPDIVLLLVLRLLDLFLQQVDALEQGFGLLRMDLVQCLDLLLLARFTSLAVFQLLLSYLDLLFQLLVFALERRNHLVLDVLHFV